MPVAMTRNVQHNSGPCFAGRCVAAILCSTLFLVPMACSSGARPRAAQSRESLIARRDAVDLRARTDHDSFLRRNLARIKAESDDYTAGRSPAPPVVDLLIVS